MPNKLTSLTGFGEGDPKPEKKDSHPANQAYWARKSKSIGANAEKFYSGDKSEHAKVTASMHSKVAKSSALNKKMGKGSASGINAERKRQGYKPMDAKRTRIHEGMDKYL